LRIKPDLKVENLPAEDEEEENDIESVNNEYFKSMHS